jgi:hypothetical protein
VEILVTFQLAKQDLPPMDAQSNKSFAQALRDTKAERQPACHHHVADYFRSASVPARNFI